MKLSELGLKTKPETKYFAGGYVVFKTENKELYDEVWVFDNNKNPFLLSAGKVQNKEHLESLLSIKGKNEVVSQ